MPICIPHAEHWLINLMVSLRLSCTINRLKPTARVKRKLTIVPLNLDAFHFDGREDLDQLTIMHDCFIASLNSMYF